MIKINHVDLVAAISFITSLYSLISRYIYSDYGCMHPSARDPNLEFHDLLMLSRYKHLSMNFIKHIVFRIVDISTNILIIGLIWHVLGGGTMSVLFGIILLLLEITFLITKQRFEFGFINYFVRMPLEETLACDCFCHCFEQSEKLCFGLLRIIISVLVAYNIADRSEYTNFVIFSSIYSLVVSIIILPLFFWKYIKPIYTAHSDSQYHSYEFHSVDNAIRLSDMDYLLFSKLMGVNPFIKSPLEKCLTRKLPDEIKSGVLLSIARQKQFDFEVYEMLKQWYDELSLQSDEMIAQNLDNVSFEDYLALQLNETTGAAYGFAIYSQNVNIWHILDLTGKVNWNKFNCNNKKRYEYGWNLLHAIVRYNDNIKIIEWFLENGGCDANSVSRDGLTSLHVLMRRFTLLYKQESTDHAPEIAQLLVKHGIDVNKKSKNGRTAKHLLQDDRIFEWLFKPM